MYLNIQNNVPLENFTIENNIIKGVHQEFPNNFQVGRLLFDTISRKPDHVSQIDAKTENKTTFLEMKERSVRCALWLRKQGIGHGDVVTVRSDDNANAYIPIFASFYLGATYNALNHVLSLEQTRALMKTIQPKVIFISGSSTEMVLQAAKMENNNVKVIVFDSCPGFQSLSSILQEQSDEEVENFQPDTVPSPESISYIILSSGTTALPKPIMHTYANLVKQVTNYPISTDGPFLWYAPTYWLGGFFNLVQIIFTSRTRIIHDQFDPEETSKVIEKYKVAQIMLTSPAVDRLCLSNVLKKYKLEPLKLAIIVGSKTNPRMLDEFHKSLPHVQICQAIGTSESGRVFACQTGNSKNIHSVGYPTSCVDIKIRDLQTNEALGPNKIGELCVKTCTIMKGYLQNEKATKETIDEEGWYHTGDVGYRNEDGELFAAGRINDVINYKNYQIWPSEIEDILLRRHDVLEAAVIAIPHDADGQHPIAFVKKAPGSSVTEQELINSFAYLDERKRLHGGVKFIDELPRLAGGKIIKRKLIEMY